MILIVRPSTIRTKTATTARTISAAISSLLLVDEGGRALDLHDLHVRAGLDHLRLVERPRRPDLSADLHPPAVQVDALEREPARADERGRPRPKACRHVQVP